MVTTLVSVVVKSSPLGQDLLLALDLFAADDPHCLLEGLRHQRQLVAKNFRWHWLGWGKGFSLIMII